MKEERECVDMKNKFFEKRVGKIRFQTIKVLSIATIPPTHIAGLFNVKSNIVQQ